MEQQSSCTFRGLHETVGVYKVAAFGFGDLCGMPRRTSGPTVGVLLRC